LASSDPVIVFSSQEIRPKMALTSGEEDSRPGMWLDACAQVFNNQEKQLSFARGNTGRAIPRKPALKILIP
jgi:hypothetical protein